MITITLLEKIEILIPGHDPESVLRRRVVRLLADAGGQLSVDALRTALGRDGRAAVVSPALQWWDGLRWLVGGEVTYFALAPWVRKRLGLPVETTMIPWEGGAPDGINDRGHDDGPRPAPADAVGIDPLARVRALVARAKNISTVAEVYAQVYPDNVRLCIAG